MYWTLYAIVLMYSLGRSFISKKVLDYVLCYTLLKFATSSKESNSGQLYITTVYTVCIILYMRYVCGNYNGTSGSRTLCFATEVISVSGSWLSCCLLPVSLWRRWESFVSGDLCSSNKLKNQWKPYFCIQWLYAIWLRHTNTLIKHVKTILNLTKTE